MIKIALTGNIASGKSTVENIISDLGYRVVDLDNISHNLLESDCKNEVLKAFNTTNRIELAKIVFSNKTELKKLEDIVHPKLREYVIKFLNENENEKMVFVSGALIYEAGFDDLFDKVIYIDANKNIRLERLMKRNSLDKESALLRIEAQKEDYKSKADFIVTNNGKREVLKSKILKILDELKINH